MYSREERHARLFALVREEIGTVPPRADEWLIELERDANNTMPGWGTSLIGFLRGLWATGLIDIGAIDRIEKDLLNG